MSPLLWASFQGLCGASARRRDPLTTSDREVVAALGDAIAQRIGQPRYNLWFADKTKFTWQGDELLVGVANHFVQEWLEKKFIDDIATAVAQVSGQIPSVRFTIDPDLFQSSRRDQAQTIAGIDTGGGATTAKGKIPSTTCLADAAAATPTARSRQTS